MSDYSFLFHIKIRIGEPITAIKLNKEGVSIGSISGYLGFYSFSTGQMRYLQEVQDELIRDIYLDKEGYRGYAAVGDLEALAVDFQQMTIQDISYAQFKQHQQQICPCTIAFIRNKQVCLFTTLPTQNKDIGDLQDVEDFDSFIFDLESGKSQHFPKVNNPKYCVPFDFDSHNGLLLWLEYKDKQQKSLQLYKLDAENIIFEKEFKKDTYSIAFGKIINNYLVYVQNFKKVICINMSTGKEETLYKHNDNIMALDWQIEQVEGEGKEEPGMLLKEGQQLWGQQPFQQVRLFTVDYHSHLIVYYNNTIIHNINILKLQNVASQISYYKYIFDMGYPYYIAGNSDYVAFTCDYGVCIIKIQPKNQQKKEIELQIIK